MHEAQLRDIIAQNIEILEPGLILLEKEQYLPNDLGTRGFIDLYAKDPQGKHVLIELKRSKQASREALHEVHKYVEGVKHYFGAKDNEIRVIVASTEWDELLSPFSRFLSDTSISAKGLKIDISSETDIKVSDIQPLAITKGRFIAPFHDMLWYYTEEALNNGISSIEHSCETKNIDDYIVMIIKLNESTIKAMEQATNNNLQNMNSHIKDYKQHGYIAYFAMQTLSKEQYLHILKKDPEEFLQVNELLADMDDEESLAYLHESAIALKPTFVSDYYEIGNDAKISKCLDDFECDSIEIKRYGKFARNINLSDVATISELRGEDGNTNRRLKQKISLRDKAEVEAIKDGICSSLEDNIVWKNHILNIIDDLKHERPNAEIEISVFNPSTSVFTIYYTARKENGFLYIPSYSITVFDPDPIRMYFGALKDNGINKNFHEIIDEFYDGDLSALLLSVTWGGKDTRDLEITKALGASYCSFRCDIDGESRTFYDYQDFKWNPCSPANPIEIYSEYLEKHNKLVTQILCKLVPKDKGFMWDNSNADLYFDELVEKKIENSNRFYANPPEKCDICEFPLLKEKYMVDGKLSFSTSWAIMCADCATSLSDGLGIGKGQLYRNTKKGWLLVAGTNEN